MRRSLFAALGVTMLLLSSYVLFAQTTQTVPGPDNPRPDGR